MAPTSTQQSAELGMIGLGVMGENLALNVEDHGYPVALWTHTEGKVQRFVEQHGAGPRLIGANTLEQFTAALAAPRRILLMVKAGAPVDEMLERLAPLLSRGDIVIDGGNSHFADTRRRETTMRERGISFVGMGVSGGEEGARYGPSLMPGGPRAAYDVLHPLLESIAAKTESGPCVTYIGPDGAGHFTKMVHNGIEYGIMQLIAEAYDLLRRGLGLPADEVAGIFAEWNRGPMASYLLEITSLVLRARDPETGRPLIEMILDQAGQKGTGKWTVQAALDLGVPIPTIAAGIDARALSALKAERVRASQRIGGTRFAEDRRVRADGHHGAPDATALVAAVGAAIAAAISCAYAQGMALLRTASREYQWNTNLREVARIWKGGCIIRARLLDVIMHGLEREPELPNLLLDANVLDGLVEADAEWRRTVQMAATHGIPVPALSASLAYFDGYRTAMLLQNLTQAQRDFFGAHTYQRADRPEAGFVHTDWREVLERSTADGMAR